ncbi:hypothetical protein Bca4012_078754 [Brassica carinata]
MILIFHSFKVFSVLKLFEYIFWKTSGLILERLSEDSRKILGRLFGKYFVFYARRLPTKSLESLSKSSAQSGTKR